MKQIDIEEARGLLARAVLTQSPEFTYAAGDGEVCLNVPVRLLPPDQPYFDDDRESPRWATGCLVGTALRLSGKVSLDVLMDKADRNAAAFDGLLTDEAEAYFLEAQVAQDAGDSWGRAYEKAEDHIGLMEAWREEDGDGSD